MAYFDYNAGTPLFENQTKALADSVEHWGNPSSVHKQGRWPKKVLRETRKKIADQLGAKESEIIFTSGATESNNSVIQSKVLMALKEKSPKNEIITSSIEHPSVVEPLKMAKDLGFVVHEMGVNQKGELDFEDLKTKLGPKTLLVTMMAANNETGLRLPIEEVAQVCQDHEVSFHTDCVQLLGKECYWYWLAINHLMKSSSHRY